MNWQRRQTHASLDLLEPRVLFAGDVDLVGASFPDMGQPVQLASDSISLRALHEITGVSYAHRQGIQGQGQTVVIIDSGVAYDHVALGGGLGEQHRVVGGWDFTEENDADPYDDGPAGFHGTHVAGIVGSSDPEHLGVAPEVDMVALRVFNDQGRGKLSWLQSSLRWVADHLHAFEHPITTVNLSIGTDWNSLTLPEYASLEDELQDLREAGVFVAGAAGNRFDGHQQGLSYPAVSPSVIAAASWDARDELSSFSQRHASVFVLPGEDITSTVPDFLEDFNGRTDDFYAASGTSMASPYLAGASILVREAMQQAGRDDVSVAAIEAVLSGTAKELYDQATDQVYYAVDVEEAIKHVLGDAPGLAPIQFRGDTIHIRGTQAADVIQIDDTGTVTINGDPYQFARDQIQQFVVTGSGEDRLQIYHGATQARISFQPQSVSLVAANYEIQAEGFRDIQVFTSGAATNASFHAGNGAEQFVSKPTHSWMKGEDYLHYVRGAVNVTATANDRLDTALFYGGEGNDVLVSRPGTATIYGDHHVATARGFASVGVRAQQGGQDRATLYGSNGNDVARSTSRYLSLKSEDHFVYVEGVAKATLVGSEGFDAAHLFDSEHDDQIWLGTDFHRIQTPQRQHDLYGFQSVRAHAQTGYDRVTLVGSQLKEVFTAKPTHSWMTRDENLSYARGFDYVEIESGGGQDFARLYDSADIDQFVLSPHLATAHGRHFRYSVRGVSRIHAVSGQDGDSVQLLGGESHDQLRATDKSVWIVGADYLNSTEGFARVKASSGDDKDLFLLASALASLVTKHHDAWLLDEHDFELVARDYARTLSAQSNSE